MSRYLHFYDLPVYKTCREFRKKISSVIGVCFPKSEEYNLNNQLLRSSRSITANIAGGFGGYHYQENIQFYRQSRGWLTEKLEHLITAFDEKYITQETMTDLTSDHANCLKELNVFIKYLKSAKETK